MQTDPAELSSMFATLCSYESWLGPYHPQTLSLMTQVGIAYSEAGELDRARPLLERAIRDTGRHLGRRHDARLRALRALRDLFFSQSDFERAEAVQRELLDCQTQYLGSDHPETLAARANLAMILMESEV